MAKKNKSKQRDYFEDEWGDDERDTKRDKARFKHQRRERLKAKQSFLDDESE